MSTRIIGGRRSCRSARPSASPNGLIDVASTSRSPPPQLADGGLLQRKGGKQLQANRHRHCLSVSVEEGATEQLRSTLCCCCCCYR